MIHNVEKELKLCECGNELTRERSCNLRECRKKARQKVASGDTQKPQNFIRTHIATRTAA